MDKRPQKPLLLAYIIFLIVALIYHIVADAIDLQFAMWERIVLAATISSYFFAMSSLLKFFKKRDSTYLELLGQYFDLAKELKKTEADVIADCETKEKLLKNGESIVDETLTIISSLKSKIRKDDTASFVFDVLGYLVFFCILSLTPIFKFFYPVQEFYTLLAFIIILTTEYIETVQSIKYEGIFKTLITDTQNVIDELKRKAELHNGNQQKT